MACLVGEVTLDRSSDQYRGSGLAWTIFHQISYFWNGDRVALREKSPELAAQAKGLATVLCAMFDDAEAAWQLPIGTIITLGVADDPATLYGYGTWEKVATGRVLVGQDITDP